MMRCVTWIAVVLAGSTLACAQSISRAVDAAALRTAVDSLLAESARAWNGGDLDGFLYWYRNAPETTYIGSVGLVSGWEGIRARYAPYFEPGAKRDSLRFVDIETRPLGSDLGLATARYVLIDEDSVTATGPFTLVLQRRPEGWRIIHDHSS